LAAKAVMKVLPELALLQNYAGETPFHIAIEFSNPDIL
jgi:ankyrin repeat protein